MGKPFSEEIDRFPATVSWVAELEVLNLRRLLTRWSDGPMIVVGSGGSYSAAYAWATLHRKRMLQSAQAATPLELAPLLEDLPDAHVFLLSAEGRNRDIRNAAEIARAYDAPCASLTFTSSNPLIDYAKTYGSLCPFTYDMAWGKDGYLATNTLLAMTLIAAKVYEEKMPLDAIEASGWVAPETRASLTQSAALAAAAQLPAVIIHGAQSRLFAIDLESKLAEAALSVSQPVDYRQFAHGRHLQMAAPSPPPIILAYTEDERAIALSTKAQFPPTVLVQDVPIYGTGTGRQMASAIVKAHLITEAVAAAAGRDPGQPEVPQFSRDLYALNAAETLPLPAVPSVLQVASRRKLNHCAATPAEKEVVYAKARERLGILVDQVFRAAVFDFDGTLCSAHERFDGMRADLRNELIRLLQEGLLVGIATGRGGSLVDDFRAKIPKDLWPKIWVGRYNGSLIARLDQDKQGSAHPEFGEAMEWLGASGAIHYVTCADPKVGQIGFRIGDTPAAQQVYASLCEWIVTKGKTGWRAYSSGHSVDLVSPMASKLNVLAALESEIGPQPILRIGDAGANQGNDFELLNSPWGISCEKVSTSLEGCWNFSPAGMRQADAALYYLKHLVKEGAGFKLTLPGR